jgi:zinc transport system substrate-binding protein
MVTFKEASKKKVIPNRLPANKVIRTFAVAVTCLLAAGCGAHKEQTHKPDIFVSILPQKYFVEKIGGTHIRVQVMVEPGMSPHTYEPKPSQMAKLSQADLYLSIGVEFEHAWVPRFQKTNSSLRVVSMDSGIGKIAMQEIEDIAAAVNHQTEPGAHADHEHGDLDPHIWLSPKLAITMCGTVLNALSMLDTLHTADFRKNYDELLDTIAELQTEIRNVIQNSSAQRFMVFHPSWGYFAQEFNLKQIPIEIEGKEPSPREMAAITDIAAKYGIRTIFIQPQFSRRTADIISGRIGAVCAVADPLACDWAENLRTVTRAFAGN